MLTELESGKIRVNAC